MHPSLHTAIRTISELPTTLGYWVNTMPDFAFYQAMVVGAIALTFVIARSLR